MGRNIRRIRCRGEHARSCKEPRDASKSVWMCRQDDGQDRPPQGSWQAREPVSPEMLRRTRRTARRPRRRRGQSLSVIARSSCDEAIHRPNIKRSWIASRSLSSGAHSRDPLARNDGFISNAVLRSRGAVRPRFASNFLALQSEGAGNAGRPMRPIAACATVVGSKHTRCQVTPESPGTPRAMVYGL